MGLQSFERRLERLVEGVFAKAFRSGLQPVELGRRLTREMDARRAVGVRGVMAPNVFTFALAPADMERVNPFLEALARELADAAREHARDEGYRFVGPVEVELQEDPTLTPGIFLVSSELKEAEGGAAVGALVLADGERVPVGDEPLTIGRLAECDVVLAEDSVSRRPKLWSPIAAVPYPALYSPTPAAGGKGVSDTLLPCLSGEWRNLVDAQDSGSCVRKDVGVQVPPRPRGAVDRTGPLTTT